MKDITSNYHGGADTSVAAHKGTPVKVRRAQAASIYRIIEENSMAGRTCDECERLLNIRHQTCSARITEMQRDGMITRTARRRATRSGRSARVYVASAIVITQAERPR